MHVSTVSVRTLSACVDCFSEDLECMHVDCFSEDLEYIC